MVTAIAKPPITTTTTTAITTITTTAATTTITTTATPILSSVDMNPLHQEMRQSVMNPGYEVKPDHLSPHVWAKHSRYLNQYVQAVKSGNPSMWSIDQVAQFVWSIPDCCHVAHNFKEQVSVFVLSLGCLCTTVKSEYCEIQRTQTFGFCLEDFNYLNNIQVAEPKNITMPVPKPVNGYIPKFCSSTSHPYYFSVFRWHH